MGRHRCAGGTEIRLLRDGAGSVIGEPALICRVIRHDDGTTAKPAAFVGAELGSIRPLRECRQRAQRMRRMTH